MDKFNRTMRGYDPEEVKKFLARVLLLFSTSFGAVAIYDLYGKKTEKILYSLPSFIRDYFVSRRSNTSTKTRLAYAYDLRGFFSWLKETTPEFLNKEKRNYNKRIWKNKSTRY